MKFGAKIATTVISMILILTIMIVGIYAASSAQAAISSNVSWTATSGITLTMSGSVVNNAEGTGLGASIQPARMSEILINTETTNAEANGKTSTLSCSFYDGTDDGVNNPSNIVFTYTIAVGSSSAVIITATKLPSTIAPVNVLISATNNESNVSNVAQTLLGGGVTVDVSTTFVLTITLSMTIPADVSVNTFDSGITLHFEKGE